MSVILFEHPMSPYAQKCKLALLEKRVDFVARTPDGLGSGTTDSDAFTAASPRGEVPVLLDDDVKVFDSTVILEYIEERWPTPALLPGTPAERARVRMLEDVMDTHYEAINWGLIELRCFHRAPGALGDTLRANAATQLEGWFAWLERALGDRPWFNGSDFGWGDVAVLPYLNCSVMLGIAPAENSRLAAWRQRALSRPTVAETDTQARATLPDVEQGHTWLSEGLMKREYRDHRLEWMIRSGGIEVVLDGLAKDNIRFSADFS